MQLFIIRDGQQTGPVSEDTVHALIQQGDLRMSDMGWRKGLPGWLPLAEILNPGTQRPSEPPPLSSIPSGVRPRLATPRQKALLQYLGVPSAETTTLGEAAMAISEALENPKLTSRIGRWCEEKLRLHPTLFQEEIDFRRSNRIANYLELCQTEGSEVVKDVTKAHVQVLIESLDKRFAGWGEEPRAALWDYLLPSVAEHFPQLVHDEWKGKLRLGGTSKVAVAYAGSAGLLLHPEPTAPSAWQAALRGIAYGLLTLGVVIGGVYAFRDRKASDVARNEVAPVEAAAPAQSPAADSESASSPIAPVVQTEPPSTAAAPQPTPDAVEKTEPATPSLADRLALNNQPSPAAPAAPPVAGATPGLPPINAATTFTPAPPPPGATPADPPRIETPAPGSPAVRDTATLTQPITIQLQFGKVTLNSGTRLRMIAIEGQNVRVNFNNNIVLVPIGSTDVDPANTVVSQAAPPLPTLIAPPIAPSPAPVTAAPTAPTGAKSSPSADL